MRPLLPITLALVLLAGTSSRVGAIPPSSVDVDEIWQSVHDEGGTEASRRAQVSRVLQHPATREVARTHGLDLAAAENRVRVLHGAELEALSQRAAFAESQLAGTSGIFISTTTIILILLVLILLLLV